MHSEGDGVAFAHSATLFLGGIVLLCCLVQIFLFYFAWTNIQKRILPACFRRWSWDKKPVKVLKNYKEILIIMPKKEVKYTSCSYYLLGFSDHHHRHHLWLTLLPLQTPLIIFQTLVSRFNFNWHHVQNINLEPQKCHFTSKIIIKLIITKI